jgi:hypothetical protein
MALTRRTFLALTAAIPAFRSEVFSPSPSPTASASASPSEPQTQAATYDAAVYNTAVFG